MNRHTPALQLVAQVPFVGLDLVSSRARGAPLAASRKVRPDSLEPAH